MTENLPEIVVIGCAYLDMTVRCDHFPQQGETIGGSGFSCIPTGSGFNQAVQAALCGCKVHLIARIGNDSFGTMIRQTLENADVDTSLVYTAEAKNTGIVVTFVNSAGENCSCICQGANKSLRAEDIISEKAEKTIASADVCLIHGEVPQEVIVSAVRTAKLHKTKVILDPAFPADQPPPKSSELPAEYFSVDILIPNFYEAAELSDGAITGFRSAKLLGSDLIARGAACVVIKMGKRGCFIVDREITEHIPAFEVEMVDRACCGNAFAGALAAFCAVGDDIRKAVKFASAAGALACTKFGSQDALPAKQEIIELLQKQSD